MIYGQLVDVVGSNQLTIEEVNDTDNLLEILHSTYPLLSNYKFAIAVDKKVIKENTSLQTNHIIALLPPFSGG